VCSLSLGKLKKKLLLLCFLKRDKGRLALIGGRGPSPARERAVSVAKRKRGASEGLSHEGSRDRKDVPVSTGDWASEAVPFREKHPWKGKHNLSGDGVHLRRRAITEASKGQKETPSSKSLPGEGATLTWPEGGKGAGGEHLSRGKHSRLFRFPQPITRKQES